MNGNTLLHRQIHPYNINAKTGAITYHAFAPMPKDANGLSVDNGDMVSPQQAFDNFTGHGYRSVGVMSVTCDECSSLELPVLENKTATNPSHTLIDFSGYAKGAPQKQIATCLLDFALNRGWTYQKDS